MQMIIKIILSLCIVISLYSCNKLNRGKCASHCVNNKITDFKKEACENGARVDEYKFQNNHVYLFDHGSCGADMTSEIIDSDCNSLGFLGGIMGNSKINGEDFSNAKYQKTVWEN